MTLRPIVSSVCLRQGSKVGRRGGGKKKKSRHQLHPATSVSPSQDTEGTEINLAAAPKNRARGSIRTGRRLCVWERAEVTVVSRVISAAPPDLQESTPRSFIQPPVSREGDTHREALRQKYNVYTPTASANGQPAGEGPVPFGETLCVMASELPSFSEVGRRRRRGRGA